MSRGRSRRPGSSEYKVLSLSWRWSSGMPPKIIAPRRPLPVGSASFQSAAGFLYQRRRPESVAAFNELMAAGARAAVLRNVLRRMRNQHIAEEYSIAKAWRFR